MNKIILQGAYGRSYDNWLQANADWYDGKDFKIENGPYCSIRDAEALRELGELRFRVRETYTVIL